MPIFSNKEYTEVRDPIYGFIKIPKVFLKIIDSRIFQRLRWVSQLPLEQLIYPSAQHSRLEHSFGTMHLAFICANSLYINDKQKLEKLFLEDTEFSQLHDDGKNQFILVSGLIGLLHDIGHAPYSHTMEEALSYSSYKDRYDHEKIGFEIINKVLNQGLPLPIYITKALKVLNKSVPTIELSGLDILLRSIVDGYFDVDKGDYLLRDSYHCGVTYGIYDYHRLWNNIVITDSNTIGVKEKAAIELWKLRFGRFNMFKNVYMHHTRNITDALLVEIIQCSIEKDVDRIMPFNDMNSITEEEIKKFECWTDSELLRDMSNLDDAHINKLINYFIERKLYKRFMRVILNSEEVRDSKNGKELKEHLQVIFDEIKKSVDYKHISYLTHEDIMPPVQEFGVSEHKLILRNNEFVSIAKYFEFSVEKSSKKKKYLLHVFVKSPSDIDSKWDQISEILHRKIDKSSLLSIWNDNV